MNNLLDIDVSTCHTFQNLIAVWGSKLEEAKKNLEEVLKQNPYRKGTPLHRKWEADHAVQLQFDFKQENHE